MSNAADHNEILRYRQERDGVLLKTGSFPTNGKGTGAALGNQSGLFLAPAGDVMLAVNAGSNEISALVLDRDGDDLTLVAKAPSGGVEPVSVAMRDGVVYVLNAGDATEPANISGFTLERKGWGRWALSAIPKSKQLLSAAAVGPAEIGFSPDGEALIVTEKATSLIDTFQIDWRTGRAYGMKAEPSSGPTPYGFAFDRRGTLLVTEAFGGAASGLSSYAVSEQGDLDVVSASVPATGEAAACWIAVTKNARWAFVSNAASKAISTYAIDRDAVTLAQAAAATTAAGPTDLALSHDNRALYVRLGSGEIDAFQVDPATGALTPTGRVGGLPASANGLVAK